MVTINKTTKKRKRNIGCNHLEDTFMCCYFAEWRGAGVCSRRWLSLFGRVGLMPSCRSQQGNNSYKADTECVLPAFSSDAVAQHFSSIAGLWDMAPLQQQGAGGELWYITGPVKVCVNLDWSPDLLTADLFFICSLWIALYNISKLYKARKRDPSHIKSL